MGDTVEGMGGLLFFVVFLRFLLVFSFGGSLGGVIVSTHVSSVTLRCVLIFFIGAVLTVSGTFSSSGGF